MTVCKINHYCFFPFHGNIVLNKSKLGAKIRNRYIQVPHLNQDTNWKVTNQQSYTTNESQEVSPLPAGDHKAQINRGTQTHAHNKHNPEKKHEISTKEVHLRTVRRKEGFNR